ncbi:bactofilin family protein [Eisenibacter elegans]|jgi:cytoskeletal protein CcmA (bactofilin family)|uniref:bactofilin family protein n=1 Tax=Eisenibacter elegans TaxID=997 RepID=UPI000479A6D7|nr:polymer-forming cytoskeletal protein [Eisenibacter elegans]
MAMFGAINNNKEKEIPVEANSNSATIIGKGAMMEGNIETHGNVRIEGRIVGNVKCKSKVVLGDSSYLEGSILSQNAEISGEVKGLIEVAEILVLKSSAIVNGDVLCDKLIVETGAVFNGSCKMGHTMKEIRIGEKNLNSAKQASNAKPAQQTTA